MKTTLCLVVACLTSGCAFTWDITGGPRRERVSLRSEDLGQQLETHVKDSPRARVALQAVRTRERVGTVLSWTGLAVNGACLATSLLSSSRGNPAGFLWPLVSICGAGILTTIIAVAVTPFAGAYGDVLRAFNLDFPETPWHSEAMGVPPAAPERLSLVPR